MSRSLVKSAVQDALPIMVAYFPIAMTFGVLSVSGGLCWWITMLISAWVYAGGAQFMLIGLILANSSPFTTVATVLMVNSRHFLYGTTLGPAFQKWSESNKWFFAFGLTDEVFAVTSSRILTQAPTPLYQNTVVYACYSSWLGGTMVGICIGRSVATSISLDLGFALPAMFLALLFLGQRSIPRIVAAISGALVAVAVSLLHWGTVGIVVGALVGATVGVLSQTNMKKGSTKTA